MSEIPRMYWRAKRRIPDLKMQPGFEVCVRLTVHDPIVTVFHNAGRLDYVLNNINALEPVYPSVESSAKAEHVLRMFMNRVASAELDALMGTRGDAAKAPGLRIVK